MTIKTLILQAKPDNCQQLSLSVSKIKTFQDCKAKFRFSYVEKLPKKDWDFHIFGKFLHEILEKFHQELLYGSQEPFSELLAKHFQLALVNWKEKLTAEQEQEAQAIIDGYLKFLLQQLEQQQLPIVLAVEKDFFINIDDKVLLNGFIDRIQIDPDGVLHVADYKTTQKLQYLKNDYFQLLTYAYVMCLEDPKLERVRTSYILLRHNFASISKEFSREEIMRVEPKFLEYAEQITNEKLFRPSPKPLCRMCDYLDLCEAGRRGLESKKKPAPTFGPTTWA